MPRNKYGKMVSGTRPLKVGEELRHAISEVLLRGECHAEGLHDTSITVSEVKVSPDLKNATVFVMPLAGEKKLELMQALIVAAPEIRYVVSKKVELRYTPRLHFKLDESFEEASKINNILKDAIVAKDINKDDGQD